MRTTSQLERQGRRWTLPVLLAIAIAGCSQSTPELPKNASVPERREAVPTPAPASTVNSLPEKVKFKHGSGETAWSIKRKDDGAKLVDATEQELARMTVDGRKLKVKDPQDVVLGWISKNETKYRILGPDSETRLFQLQRQEDGDWKLEDPQGQLICKFKKREYGYEAEGPAEQSLFKAKLDGDKRSLRNVSEETILYTKDSFSTLGVAVIGLETIESLPLRVALATFLTLNGE